MHIDSYLWLIPALPLLGFLVNGLHGNRFSHPTVGIIATLGPLVSFVLSVLALLQANEGHPASQLVWTWMNTGNVSVDMGLQADPLTCVMLMNVAGIGTAIHVFSYGYMHEDPSFARFMAYLNLFLCAMLVLVMADNLVLLFVGWEGVGLCSYLLIGFWYDKIENVDAGRKAFVVNRIGDFAFLIGLFTLFSLTATVSFTGIESALHSYDLDTVLDSGPLQGWTIRGALTLAALCLFGGATGKSAQIPLYIWLPDAMAGPTPVSALIHAATMVTAGVYLVGRMDFLFVLMPEVGQVVAIVAACTALLSGLIAVAQDDIKKILAYSTVSQLGFMFCGMATTMWVSGLFHVVTHAFFKALLFLGAGAIIHAMHGEQRISRMGGLWKDLRFVSVLFLIGSLALAGVPPFAGFFSKDSIMGAVLLLATEQGGLWGVVFAMLLATAVLTAFYTTRLVIITFFGEPHDSHRHLHHPHWTMTSVLAVLAVLATTAGFTEWAFEPLENFTTRGSITATAEHSGEHAADGHGEAGDEHGENTGVHAQGELWSTAQWVTDMDGAAFHEAEHSAHLLAMILSTVAALGGIALGAFIYGSQRKALTAFVQGSGAPLRRIAENKFYVDELYEWLIVSRVTPLSKLLWRYVDRMLIDGGAVEGPGKLVLNLGSAVRYSQVGVVSVATTAILFGAVIVLMWMVLHG